MVVVLVLTFVDVWVHIVSNLVRNKVRRCLFVSWFVGWCVVGISITKWFPAVDGGSSFAVWQRPSSCAAWQSFGTLRGQAVA